MNTAAKIIKKYLFFLSRHDAWTILFCILFLSTTVEMYPIWKVHIGKLDISILNALLIGSMLLSLKKIPIYVNSIGPNLGSHLVLWAIAWWLILAVCTILRPSASLQMEVIFLIRLLFVLLIAFAASFALKIEVFYRLLIFIASFVSLLIIGEALYFYIQDQHLAPTGLSDQIQIGSLIYRRILGPAYDPNFSASFILPGALSLLLTLFSSSLKPIFINTKKTALFLIMLLAFFLTGSRSMLLILFVSILILTFINLKRHQQRFVFWGRQSLLTGALILFTCLMTFAIYNGRGSSGGGSNQERILLLIESLELSKSSPLLGFGFPAPKVKTPLRLTANETHNLYLEILLSFGLLALIPFLIISVYSFYLSKAPQRLLLLGLLSMGMFLHLFSIHFFLLTFFVSLSQIQSTPERTEI